MVSQSAFVFGTGAVNALTTRIPLGVLVMEIPFTSASSQEDAIRRAEELRSELARQIPDLRSLFGK
jgi:hypothetical protein